MTHELKESGTHSIHPAVGVVGVGAIGGVLGAIAGGPLGAIIGASIGALTASVENAKLAKPGYYTRRTDHLGQPAPLSPLAEPAQLLDGIADRDSKNRLQAGQGKNAKIDDLARETQSNASNAAPRTQSSPNDLGKNSPDVDQNGQQRFKAVLIDIDGTLVLSNDAHAEAWVEAFAAFGYDIKFDQVRPLIGMGGDKVVPRMVPELSGEEGLGKQIVDRRKELIIHKFGPNLSPTPGSRELILKLKQENFKLIVASSATSEELSVLLKAAQVEDLLGQEPATTSSDAENSKPSPDLVQAALSKAQLKPEEAVMLGDAPYDIQAANAAGVDVIAVRSGGFDDSQLAGALAIYDHPGDLLAQYEQSPFKQSATSKVGA